MEPYLYVYEYDTYNGCVHREFSPIAWNGMQPARTIALYRQPPQQGAAVTDDEIRAEWRAAGGSMHGPNVETVTMPEAQYLQFRRSLTLQAEGAPKEFFIVTYVQRNGNGEVELSRVAWKDWPEWTHELRGYLMDGEQIYATCREGLQVPTDAEEVAVSLCDDAEVIRREMATDSEIADNMVRAAEIIDTFRIVHAPTVVANACK